MLITHYTRICAISPATFCVFVRRRLQRRPRLARRAQKENGDNTWVLERTRVRDSPPHSDPIELPDLGRVGRGGVPLHASMRRRPKKLKAVINAEADFYRQLQFAIHRGTHLLGDGDRRLQARGHP